MMTLKNKTLSTAISRRGFLAGSAGLTFAITTAGLEALAPSQALAAAHKISAWVSIGADNVITILNPAAEMGQGSGTSVPLILAEEMDADWSKVQLEYAPADASVYGYENNGTRSMSITGSHGVERYYAIMRTAGAQVRRILLEAAAAKWQVPVGELATGPSVVIHTKSGRRMSYGEIASFAKAPDKMPEIAEADLKQPSQFRLIGKDQARRDMPAKVDGSAQYAIDVRLPGMVYATVLHSPAQGGVPQAWNEAAVKALAGIEATVKLPNGIAIVGHTFEAVLQARPRLEVVWDTPKSTLFNSEAALATGYVKYADDPEVKVTNIYRRGDVEKAFADATRILTAEFRSDYGYHALMEPLNAVARFGEDGKSIEVWDGTQAPDRCRTQVAKAVGLPEAQVTVHQCYLGGGMGRRSIADYTVEAALIAKAVGKPVKMIWTREEDFANGMFRPQTFQRMAAAIDKDGKVVGWRHLTVGDRRNLVTGGMRIRDYYDVPHQNLEWRDIDNGIRVKQWRAVARVFNTFAIEALTDELAVAANMDPIEFRLKNLAPTKTARAVLAKVAEMSDWQARRPEGRALGLSLADKAGAFSATVVEVSLDRATGKIHVHKIWSAVKGGIIVQPDAARANIESAMMNGLSSVLTERITVKAGVVEQSNFHDYHILRMSEIPELVQIEFLASTAKPGGLGEIGNPPIPAAIAAAFFRLTGKRLRHLPFTPDRVKAALTA